MRGTNLRFQYWLVAIGQTATKKFNAGMDARSSNSTIEEATVRDIITLGVLIVSEISTAGANTSAAFATFFAPLCQNILFPRFQSVFIPGIIYCTICY